MRNEDSVPLAGRYLMLASRVFARRFEHEKKAALEWCLDNAQRLTPDDVIALRVLQATGISGSTLAFVQYAAYADIPQERTYSATFSLATPAIGSSTRAVLRVAIFFRRLPQLTLEHGHHHFVVFDFPDRVPDVIETMRVDVFDGGVTAAPVALCDWATWDLHRLPSTSCRA